MVGLNPYGQVPRKPTQAQTLDPRQQNRLHARCVRDIRIQRSSVTAQICGCFIHVCLARFLTAAYASSGDNKTIINQTGIEMSERITRLSAGLLSSIERPASAPVSTASISGADTL